jgi:hypothetical protein
VSERATEARNHGAERLEEHEPVIDPKATLTIIRNAPDDVQDRWVRVFIDEGPEEILRYGRTLTRELPAGRHRVRAHNTLSADTIEFDAAPGEALRINVYNRVAKGGVLMLMATGFAFINVRLELTTESRDRATESPNHGAENPGPSTRNR